MQNKILIVEDDQFVSELYDHQFTKYGFFTKVANDGEKALELVRTYKFDAVLLDIMIPKLDGIEVLKKLKADSSTKNTVVVILSNLGQDDLIKQALQIGAKAYIIKSLYTPDQVVSEVRSIIGV
ncbi:MAG: response regulator [bacterium]|nr:response regulator [bacterium]